MFRESAAGSVVRHGQLHSFAAPQAALRIANVSLGMLIIQRGSMTHAYMPAERRNQIDIASSLIHLAGLRDAPEDIIDDLDHTPATTLAGTEGLTHCVVTH